MGVFGWQTVQDNVTLRGAVLGDPFFEGNDDDWNFYVRPGPPWQYLSIDFGEVKCEIEPPAPNPPSLNPQRITFSATEADMKEHLQNITGSWVTVLGTWAFDLSHQPIKPEIHPILSLLIERPPAADNSSRVLDFFVFSSLGSVTHWVPGAASAAHTDEDRLGTVDVLVPKDSQLKILYELDHSNSAAIHFANQGPHYWWLRGRVQSGAASEGKGFYHGRIELRPGYTLRTFLFSRGAPPEKGVRNLMNRAGVSSVRALFRAPNGGL